MRARILRKMYAQVRDGLPALGTPEETAARVAGDDPTAQADKLTALYVSLCGTTGFTFSLGGWLTLPITLPANLAGVALLQLHMAATFAHLGGRRLDDDATRDAVIDCLIRYEDLNGRSPQERDEVHEATDRIGLKLAERGLRFVTERAVKFVAGRAGRAALSRVGWVRGVPLVGGLIGGVSDAVVTRQVARCARDTFLTPDVAEAA